MIIHFHISYKTMFGEQIVVNIQKDDEEVKFPLTTLDGECWSYDWCVEPTQQAYTYYYSVVREGVVLKTEWLQVKHRLDMTAKKAAEYTLYDHWKVIPQDSYLYSSAFTDCINHQAPQEMKPCKYAKTVRIIVRAPQLRDGESLGLLGAGQVLGNWNLQNVVPMTQHIYNEWAVDLDATQLQSSHLELKFVAVDKKKAQVLWETGMNRTIDLPEMKAGDVVVYDLDQAYFALYNRKLAGTQVPVFSLRSEKSAGVGDFGDLKTMIDLVASTGQKVLQLLPINDTTITHTWTVKAYWTNCLMEVPLKIHSLSRLAERTGLDKQLSEEQLAFIDKLEPLNIEARYPSYKERLMKSLTKEYCAELLSQTKELQLWIKNKL